MCQPKTTKLDFQFDFRFDFSVRVSVRSTRACSEIDSPRYQSKRTEVRVSSKLAGTKLGIGNRSAESPRKIAVDLRSTPARIVLSSLRTAISLVIGPGSNRIIYGTVSGRKTADIATPPRGAVRLTRVIIVLSLLGIHVCSPLKFLANFTFWLVLHPSYTCCSLSGAEWSI